MIPILAHGLGGRSDLPVPLWLALYGGAAAVIVSFTALGAFWREPRLDREEPEWILPGYLTSVLDSRLTRGLMRAIGLTALGLTLAVAAFGDESSAANPVPTWFYVWFWVGLIPASLVLGPVWRLLNPLRAISAALARASGRSDGAGSRALPERFGFWPAAAGLSVFVWLELVYQSSDDPVTVLVFISAYSLVNVILAQTYGLGWYDRGDGFEVYSSLIGRLSPLGRDSRGRLAVRNPLRNLSSLRPEPGLLAVACVLLGSTAFDGLSRTELWRAVAGDSLGLANALIGTAGLAASIGFVAVTYAAATRLSARFVTNPDVGAMPDRFVHTLVPIIVGYTVAHYFSFFVFQGQAGYILASDPWGTGADVFGTGGWTINYTAVSTRTIALVQVAAIVLGHVVAVVAAHDRSMSLFPVRSQTRGQYALLAVMVTYTVGGIALLVGT